MKFLCPDHNTKQIVEALSFEENDLEEASPHNGIDEHTHCPECGAPLTIENCLESAYILPRLNAINLAYDQLKNRIVDFSELTRISTQWNALHKAHEAAINYEHVYTNGS